MWSWHSSASFMSRKEMGKQRLKGKYPSISDSVSEGLMKLHSINIIEIAQIKQEYSSCKVRNALLANKYFLNYMTIVK